MHHCPWLQKTIESLARQPGDFSWNVLEPDIKGWNRCSRYIDRHFTQHSPPINTIRIFELAKALLVPNAPTGQSCQNTPKIYNFAWQLRVLPSFARLAPLHRDFLCTPALEAWNSSFVLGPQPWSWWSFPPLSLGHGWSQELSNVNLWQRKVEVSSPCNVFLEIYLRHKSTYKHNMHDIMMDFRLLYKDHHK